MMKKTTVAMELIGDTVYIEVRLWNLVKDRYSKMYMLFDTGASVTTISKSIVNDLRYNLTDCEKTTITTASGISYVDVVTLKNIKINNIELKYVKV